MNGTLKMKPICPHFLLIHLFQSKWKQSKCVPIGAFSFDSQNEHSPPGYQQSTLLIVSITSYMQQRVVSLHSIAAKLLTGGMLQEKKQQEEKTSTLYLNGADLGAEKRKLDQTICLYVDCTHLTSAAYFQGTKPRELQN